MSLYVVTIKLKSALGTPLKGDTIWGHVVWGIARNEGDEAVKAFLEESKTGTPPFVVSSAFPHGYICKPLPQPRPRDSAMTKEKYADIKKAKKLRYENASGYLDATALSENASPMRESIEDVFESHPRMHNSINRFTGTVDDNAGVYSSAEIWCKTPKLDVYVESVYEPQRVQKLCEWAFENGYGADSSSGKGWITVEGVQKVAAKRTGDKKYVALAPFVLSPADYECVKDLRADVFVRAGKTGGSISSVPWKKPVVMYDEGAVFECGKNITHIGSLIPDVHSDPRIASSGFAPVIPL